MHVLSKNDLSNRQIWKNVRPACDKRYSEETCKVALGGLS
jgi:hypothetical protein